MLDAEALPGMKFTETPPHDDEEAPFLHAAKPARRRFARNCSNTAPNSSRRFSTNLAAAV
jgi:hypothetical protein